MVLPSSDGPKEVPIPDTTTETKTQDEGIHVVIIGAGLAGLAAALSTKLANPNHQVTILEAVKELQEVGCPPPSPSTATTGRSSSPTNQTSKSGCWNGMGFPFWDLHRVDLQREMVKKCSELGITIRLNSRVTSVDFETNTVHLGLVQNPARNTLSGDVILLTDGLWSLPHHPPRLPPGPVPTPTSSENSSQTPQCTSGSAPHSHCVGYSVSSSQTYNLVFLCPDDMPSHVARSDASLREFRSKFSGWDPLLQKLISQIQSVQKWKLMWLDPLPNWTNPQGTFFLAGDCCHPMLPYLAQGANSSLEDGAVFGHLLSKVRKSTSSSQLPKMGRLYEHLRMERGRRIQLETFNQRNDSHLPDGPAQQARDELMTSQLNDDDVRPGFPSRWTDPEIQAFLYGYDAYEEAERAYQESPY
ncbi:uncharacterized protein PODANS_2_3250 [Podospora anserina S mat+]|uniref:Podospora anserina S mat+ genomic DNA chromosome 2, supercontig 2 n=1 Tax=Podospora anserina (strain S / ATCC MYA-4624 / DSM 980 / FGSC 10383) TaxID=515849 RepID=B2B519_PODAN|nr:uncharacterized protein PODANS_2_3250 [Podospora anserina S mat+]CAP72894.1 unnamed protein product [Podospora anserina S mat+]